MRAAAEIVSAEGRGGGGRRMQTSVLSRIALGVGIAGLAILLLFVFLVVYSYIDLFALVVFAPFAVGTLGGGTLGSRKRIGNARIGGEIGKIGDDIVGAIGRAMGRFRPAQVPPPPPPDLDEWVGAQIGKLSSGRMTIDAPDACKIGHEEKVVVAISKTEVESALGATPTGRQVQAHAIKVGTLMHVSLHGSKAFTIHSPDMVDQIVIENEATQWEFRIVPLIPGTHTLTVKATVRVPLPDGTRGYYSLPAVERQIVVKVTLGHVFKRFFAVPFVKFATGTTAAAGAILGFVFGLEPVKLWAGERLRPVFDWVTTLIG